MRAWLVALATVWLVLMPTGVAGHEGTEVTVKGEVRPGGPIELAGEAFDPNDIVRIELRKADVAPVALARVPADENGAFSVTLHVPDSVAPGLYQLAAEGADSATTEVTVLASAAPSERPDQPDQPEAVTSSTEVENDRPGEEMVGLAAFTAALALLASALLWLGRTRPHHVS